MKTRLFVFYAISILSLSLFVILPAAENTSFDNAIPKFNFSQVLIESVDRLVSAKH